MTIESASKRCLSVLVMIATLWMAPPAWAQTQADAAADGDLEARPDLVARLYSEAREALTRGEYERAIQRFEEFRRLEPASDRIGESYYFEAFARQRTGRTEELRRAASLLAGPAAAQRDAASLLVRVQAELARRGDAESRARVEEAARQDECDESALEVRLMALSALQTMDSDRAVPILQEFLTNRDACMAPARAQAVFVLSQQMNDESVDLLLDLAHRNPDPDPEVRQAAVFWLSEVESEEAVDALIAIIAESDDPELLEGAIFALSEHDSDRAGDALRQYALRTDADDELRAEAIFWLGDRSDADVLPFLRDLYPTLDSDELKEQVLFAYSEAAGDEDLDWLVQIALDPNESDDAREQALFWASDAGIPANTLRDIYETSDDSGVREQTLFALSESDDPAAVDILLDVARSGADPELREQAVFWLSQIDDPRVEDFLVDLLTNP